LNDVLYIKDELYGDPTTFLYFLLFWNQFIFINL